MSLFKSFKPKSLTTFTKDNYINMTRSNKNILVNNKYIKYIIFKRVRLGGKLLQHGVNSVVPLLN